MGGLLATRKSNHTGPNSYKNLVDRYGSRCRWLKDDKFLKTLEGDSVDTDILDEELRLLQADEPKTCRGKTVKLLEANPLQIAMCVLVLIDAGVVMAEILLDLHAIRCQQREATAEVQAAVDFLEREFAVELGLTDSKLNVNLNSSAGPIPGPDVGYQPQTTSVLVLIARIERARVKKLPNNGTIIDRSGKPDAAAEVPTQPLPPPGGRPPPLLTTDNSDPSGERGDKFTAKFRRQIVAAKRQRPEAVDGATAAAEPTSGLVVSGYDEAQAAAVETRDSAIGAISSFRQKRENAARKAKSLETDSRIDLSDNDNTTENVSSANSSVSRTYDVDTGGIFAPSTDYPPSSSYSLYAKKLLKIAHILHYGSIAILGVFVVQVFLKMFGIGVKFFRNKLEVFDGAVIMASFALDMVFIDGITEAEGEETIALIIMFLLWRILRVINGLLVTSKKRQEFRIQLQKRACRRAEKRNEVLEDDANWKDKEIHSLKGLCQRHGICDEEITACKPKRSPFFHKMDTTSGLSSIASLSLGFTMSMRAASGSPWTAGRGQGQGQGEGEGEGKQSSRPWRRGGQQLPTKSFGPGRRTNIESSPWTRPWPRSTPSTDSTTPADSSVDDTTMSAAGKRPSKDGGGGGADTASGNCTSRLGLDSCRSLVVPCVSLVAMPLSSGTNNGTAADTATRRPSASTASPSTGCNGGQLIATSAKDADTTSCQSSTTTSATKDIDLELRKNVNESHETTDPNSHPSSNNNGPLERRNVGLSLEKLPQPIDDRSKTSATVSTLQRQNASLSDDVDLDDKMPSADGCQANESKSPIEVQLSSNEVAGRLCSARASDKNTTLLISSGEHINSIGDKSMSLATSSTTSPTARSPLNSSSSLSSRSEPISYRATSQSSSESIRNVPQRHGFASSWLLRRLTRRRAASQPLTSSHPQKQSSPAVVVVCDGNSSKGTATVAHQLLLRNNR